jgi:hypothetical protein
MEKETLEVTLNKLTDALEYVVPGSGMESGFFNIESDEYRERQYQYDVENILSNRRFRKAYEDLQKANRKNAATLLIRNIRENLEKLRPMFQEDVNMVSQERHKGNFGRVLAVGDDASYRSSSNPDYPPSRTARRYAVFSYIFLASLLELRDVRPAIEKVIEFAKEEYNLFNSLGNDVQSFKIRLLQESLYNPSLLITATLCEPKWNEEKRKSIEAKLVHREVVDWLARATEYDMPGKECLVPVEPYSAMLKIRYYKEITDEEFRSILVNNTTK